MLCCNASLPPIQPRTYDAVLQPDLEAQAAPVRAAHAGPTLSHDPLHQAILQLIVVLLLDLGLDVPAHAIGRALVCHGCGGQRPAAGGGSEGLPAPTPAVLHPMASSLSSSQGRQWLLMPMEIWRCVHGHDPLGIHVHWGALPLPHLTQLLLVWMSPALGGHGWNCQQMPRQGAGSRAVAQQSAMGMSPCQHQQDHAMAGPVPCPCKDMVRAEQRVAVVGSARGCQDGCQEGEVMGSQQLNPHGAGLVPPCAAPAWVKARWVLGLSHGAARLVPHPLLPRASPSASSPCSLGRAS